MKHLITLIPLYLSILTGLSAPHVFAQNHTNIEKVSQSNTQFAVDLYKQIKAEQGNLFFSPYSISTALVMTYAGTRGQTAKQMAAVLHLTLKNEELHSAFAEIQTRLNVIQQEEKVQLSIANSLWPQDKYSFLKEYLELARRNYKTEITPVDYEKDPETARLKINTWVEGKTNNRIKNIIPDTLLLPPRTRLVLVNAIYFKCDWVTKFEKSATTEKPFHLDENKSIEVPMMHQESYLNYAEDEIVQVLEMPYAGNELSMLIALPREIDGLQNIEELLTVESLAEWSKNLSTNRVDVYLPRFKMTFQFDLKKVLEAMGMKDAFDMGKANFAGMDGTPNWLYIEFALHKAFVDVNEEGTEAAAATAGGCFPAGTEVLTARGPRPIETVEPGTKLYAYNLATEEWLLTSVRKRQSHQYEGDMIRIQTGHTTIRATGNHPFHVLKGDRLSSRPLPQDVPKEEQGNTEHGRWVEARELKEGDVLMDRSGKGLIITRLSSRQERTEVHNLDVEGYHNYTVHQKGILVHNKAGKAKAPEPIIFRADHPFFFLIRENLTDSILFMGRVNNPLIE